MVLIGMGAQAATRRRWAALSLLSSHFVDVVGGLATLRAYRRDGAQKSILAGVGEGYRRETMATLRIAFLSAFALELVAMMGTALVAVTVGIELLRGDLGLQAGLTVLLLAPELYTPLRGVGQQFHASADGLAAAQRIFEVLDEPPQLRSVAQPQRPPELDHAAIQLEGVCFEYPRRDGLALRGVDLELAPGSFTALVGANGAGKSTIAMLLLRLADPTAGRVICGGVDLRDVDAGQWRSQIAWVPQRARLFAGSVAENIRLGSPDAADRDVLAAAQAAGATEFISALPDGFETPIGDGGRRLSAGQGQRIALARAFLRAAPLLILDEPSANLDASLAASLGEIVAQLAVGRTTLLIAHRPALAALAHRIVRLDAGRIVANDLVTNSLVAAGAGFGAVA
jgi:ATP-binding cassette subfamily C protein CydD